MRLTGFTPLVRLKIQERSGGLCERCGKNPVEQHHHRRPRGSGGSRRPETNKAANALGLCMYCHADIEDHRSQALKYGWLVPQHRIPSEVPVLRRGLWAMLDDHGDYVSIPEPATGGVA